MSTAAVNGLFVGSVYGLFALGLVVAYRGSRVVNFAHGETGMLGTFAFVLLWADGGLPLGLSLIAGVALSSVLGAATYLVLVRPLREDSPLRAMVVTLGVAALLLTFAGRWFGVQPRYVPPLLDGSGIAVAGLQVHPMQLLALACIGAIVLGMWVVDNRTASGLRARAVALDADVAGQLGVRVHLVSALQWGFAGALAGLSGILISSRVAFHVFFMTGLTLRGLAAALVGGLTNPLGAVAAGLLLGFVEAVLAFRIDVQGLTEAVLALFVIVLLMLRPAGLVRAEY